MKKTVRFLVCLLFPFTIRAQARPITPEDVLSIREIRNLQLSPDGARVAFTIVEPHDPAKPLQQRRSTIWFVSTAGSEAPRAIASASANDVNPRWSPDGKRIAFLSDREGSAQVLIQGVDDAVPTRLTSAAGGVELFEWSPDGSMIAFTARDQRTAEEVASVEAGYDAIEVDGDFKYARLWIATVSDGRATRVGNDDFEIQELTWSPDGREIAAVTTPTPRAEDSFPASLVVIDRSSGKVVRSLSDHIAFPGGTKWSPNGRWIVHFDAAKSNAFAAWISVVPAAGGAVRPILRNYAGSVLRVQWLPDGQHFMAQAIEGTRNVLLIIDAATGEKRQLAKIISSQWDVSFSTNGRVTTYLAQSPKEPSDIFVLADDKPPRRLTDLNPQTRTWSLGDVAEVTWKNTKDALLRRGILVTPSTYDAKRSYPMIVIAHPSDTAFWPGWLTKGWLWAQLLASNGYVVFLPNYRGVTGEGANMHSTIGDWGVALQDLEDGVDAMIARGIADPDRLGIGGWSNGGYMTAWTISQTQRYKAAIAQAAHTDLFSLFGTSYLRPGLLERLGNPHLDRTGYDARSSITFARNIKTPTLLLHGINDQGVPVGQAYELHAALKTLGVPTQMVVYPREGHSIREYAHQLDLQRRVLAWFDRYLKR